MEIDVWFAPVARNSTILKSEPFVDKPKSKQTEEYYQDYFCQQLSLVTKVFKKEARNWNSINDTREKSIDSVSIYSTQDHIFLDGRKPDVTIIPMGAPLTQMHVLSIGEIKPPKTTGFSNDAKGEVLTFALRILKVQPNRSAVTCFLTDTQLIKFFRATRVIRHTSKVNVWKGVGMETVHYEESKTYSLLGKSEGVRLLLQLIATAAKSYIPPNIPQFPDHIVLDRWLGRGATSNVFCGLRNSTQVFYFFKTYFKFF